MGAPHRFNIFRSWGANRARGAAGAHRAGAGAGAAAASVWGRRGWSECRRCSSRHRRYAPDLAQAARSFFRCTPIVSGRRRGAQQAGGFVVEHGAAGRWQARASLVTVSGIVLLSVSTLKAVDRSREKCAFFERPLGVSHAAPPPRVRVPTHHRESCLAAPESGQQQDADSEGPYVAGSGVVAGASAS